MAVTQNSYIGNGSTTNYSFTFPYLKSSEVKAQIDATVTTAFTLANATTVQFNTAPANGAKIKIYRETDTDSLAATFYAGSAIKAEDLNDNFTQNLYTTQEVNARYLSNLGGTMVGDMTMAEDVDIIFEGATDDAYETRLTVADPTADRTVTIPNVTGTVVTTGDTGTVTSAMLATGAIGTDDLAANAVTTAKITDANVTTAKIANDAITGAKIADDTINSEHYVDGSIDTAHIADLNITTAKIAADAITGAKIADDAVDSEHLAADSIDTEHYAPASVDTAALANTSVTTAKIANDAITGSQIADNAITSDHMSSNSVVLSNMSDNSVGTSEIVDDAVTNAKIASGAVDTSNIAGSALITNSEQASTTGNDTTLLTSAASDSRYFKQDSTETISSGQTWTSSDSYIATTGAVNARILDLVDDVGGFKTIDNETSFPDTNPDPQNGTGTIISIKGLSTAIVTGSGETTKTISNGNVSNNATITITGLTENTTYGQNMGLLVETTSTTHTYTFHRLVPPPTSITTVSNNIASVNTTAANIATVNDFADKYRIANSAPSSNNDDGDLYYNTNDNKLYVYNGSSWEVAASLNGSGGSVTGDTTFSDSTKLKLGTGEDLQIYHNGTDTYIDNDTNILFIQSDTLLLEATNGENYVKSTVGSDVELYYDNVKKFETYSGGCIVTGQLSTDAVSLGDSEKILVGAGDDLQIYHSGTNSVIDNNTGDLVIRNNVGGDVGGDITIQAKSGENSAKFTHDGSVELRYDNVKKLETTSTGVQISGTNLNMNSTYIDFSGNVSTPQTGAAIFRPAADTLACSINNVERVRIDSSGNLNVPNDSGKLRFGTDADLQIYHDAANSYIKNTTGDLRLLGSVIKLNNAANTETCLKTTEDAGVELYYDNALKFYTQSYGTVALGDKMFFGDNTKIEMGAASDLQIYHSSSSNHSYIRNSQGILHIDNYDGDIKIRPADGDEGIKVVSNGAVELYYDNSKKLETTSTGVTLVDNLVLDNATNAGRDIQWQPGSDRLAFFDNTKATFGDGVDLEIYHNGSNSFISDTGTGNLHLTSNGTAVSIDKGTSENMAVFNIDGSVDLYYDGVKKLETYTYGVKTEGHVWLSRDNDKAYFGAGSDLEIYHDGTKNFIKSGAAINTEIWSDTFYVKSVTGAGEAIIKGSEGGAVELYYDNVKKLETTSTGTNTVGIHIDDGANHDGDVNFYGANYNIYWDKSANALKFTDNAKLWIGDHDGSGDLHIYHDGTNSYITNGATGGILYLQTYGENAIKCHPNAAVELYYDGAKQCETNSGGMNWADSKRAYFGNSSDLQIYHNGSESFITETTSDLNIKTTAAGKDVVIRSMDDAFMQVEDGESGVVARGNGTVELYYDNSKKLETTSTGAKVTGALNLTSTLKLFDLNSPNDENVHINVQDDVLILNAFATNGEFQFKTGSSSTLALTVDSSQNATFAGDVDLTDGSKILVGTHDDMQLYHTSNASYIKAGTNNKIHLDSATSDAIRIISGGSTTYGKMADFNTDGSVELYYDNSKKLATNSDGVDFGDNVKLRIGDAPDYKIYHNGTNTYHENYTGDLFIKSDQMYLASWTSGENYLHAVKDGAVSLYYDNSKKLETDTNGIFVNGALRGDTVDLADSKKILLGSGDDLEIYHDGSHSYVDQSDSGAGNLHIRGNGSDVIKIQAKKGEQSIICNPDAKVELYYDSSKKLETTASGVNLTSGHLYPNTDNTHDLGTAGNRWRNIYTNDLHLSNQGHSNDVDGTWGDWTLQEGESDLFLKNNRSGKKYKFNLTEVS